MIGDIPQLEKQKENALPAYFRDVRQVAHPKVAYALPVLVQEISVGHGHIFSTILGQSYFFLKMHVARLTCRSTNSTFLYYILV